jgi:hypothetical protein
MSTITTRIFAILLVAGALVAAFGSAAGARTSASKAKAVCQADDRAGARRLG